MAKTQATRLKLQLQVVLTYQQVVGALKVSPRLYRISLGFINKSADS